MNKITLLIQARTGSSRLPSKVLMKLGNKSVLKHIFDRTRKCEKLDSVIICTTINNGDDPIAKLCSKNNIKVYRGSENNLLDRFYQAALISNSNILLRCTADCPLLDPIMIDNTIEYFLENNFDYVTFVNSKYKYDGFNVEVFSFKSLKNAWKNATSQTDLEHVTPYIIRNNNIGYFTVDLFDQYPNIDYTKLHLSLDTRNDYILLRNIFENIDSYDFRDVLQYINDNIHILDIQHNKTDICQDLYKKAKQFIPGGTQSLLKNPDTISPNDWPTYYQKASGIMVATLDSVKFQDFSCMGLGTCILGYNDIDVNREVHKAINRGNMSSLNCPSDVKLVELLCEIHPWADMARYTHSGQEAYNKVIQIARVASNKDKIALCGWHDWYQIENKDMSFHFTYNKIGELEEIIANQDIGTIIMEPQRNEKPKDNFLHKVRALANKHNIILVFDEVTSGFRINTGGIHLIHGIYPDISIFGKAISNGYPIGIILGTKEVMEYTKHTFTSDTFWTEDIGPTAAIATITKYRKLNVGKYLFNLGSYFQSELTKISKETGVKLDISGLPSLITFYFEYDDSLYIKTQFIKKMLKRNILAKDCLYLSYAHTRENIDFYLKNIKEIFVEIQIEVSH